MVEKVKEGKKKIKLIGNIKGLIEVNITQEINFSNI